MVVLERIKEDDKDTLYHLLHNHLKYTNSPRANEILENWDNSLLKFIKIFPAEYKNALEKQKANKAEDNLATLEPEQTKEKKILV